MLFSYHNPHITKEFRQKGHFVSKYIFTASHYSKEVLTSVVKNIGEIQELREENERLRAQLNKLLFREDNYYREIESANRRLRELLEFKERSSYRLIPAEPLGYSPEDFFKVIYVNKGAQSGVQEGMGLVNPQGLVGKVVEVYTDHSKVLLMVDKRSKVGVRVQRTRDVGILQGTGNPEVCELLYILNRAEVKEGDRVVTSGLGGLFPPGILVGRILHTEKTPGYLFQKIKVEPMVDFGKLEGLFLVARNE